MKTKNQIKPFLFKLLIVFSLISFVMTSFTLAKYTNTLKVEDSVTLEHFDVSIDAPSLAAAEKNGVFTLKKSDYDSFAFALKYKGKGKSYIRVLVEESWIYIDNDGTETIVFSSGLSQYTLASKGGGAPYGVFDNRGSDGYLYIQGPTYNETDTGFTTIPVVTGAKASLPGNSKATHVKITVKVDAVQYNRYKRLWNITGLPY